AGVLNEIKVKEGETVPVNSVVAVIGEAAGEPVAPTQAAPTPAAVKPSAPPPPPKRPEVTATPPPPVAKPQGGVAKTPVGPPEVAPPPAALAARPWSAEEARQLRLSPLVRRIAREHHVDVRNIRGSGTGGRVTKADILSYIEAGLPVSAPQGGASTGQ